MSGFNAPPPLPIVVGAGLLAALTLPSGVDEAVMRGVVGVADMLRSERRGGLRGPSEDGASNEGREGDSSGDCEEGDSTGLSSPDGGSMAEMARSEVGRSG